MLNLEVVDGPHYRRNLKPQYRGPIQVWFDFLQREEKMTSVPMDYEQRCSCLSQVFRELVSRLQSPQVTSSKARV
jgi:hypothetical protein